MTDRDLWVLSLEGDRKAFAHLRTPFNDMNGDVSPGGKWMAYQSDESGRPEACVQVFPVPGARCHVSTGGGSHLWWYPDGKRLGYTHGPTAFAVEVQTAPEFRVGQPREVDQAPAGILGMGATRDLKRILVLLPAGEVERPSITVMLDWAGALRSP